MSYIKSHVIFKSCTYPCYCLSLWFFQPQISIIMYENDFATLKQHLIAALFVLISAADDDCWETSKCQWAFLLVLLFSGFSLNAWAISSSLLSVALLYFYWKYCFSGPMQHHLSMGKWYHLFFNSFNNDILVLPGWSLLHASLMSFLGLLYVSPVKLLSNFIITIST